MNKNIRNNVNLNTINIFYHHRADNNYSINDTKIKETSKEQKDTVTHNTIQDTVQFNEAKQMNDFFNDSNLKYGKSQTLKESTFNRFRLHIYRREKKSKWLELLQKSQKIQESNKFGEMLMNSMQPKGQRIENARQNRTCSKRMRVEKNIEEESRNKTKTYEENEFRTKMTARDSPRLKGKIQKQLLQIQRNNTVISKMNKLHEIISSKRNERIRIQMSKQKVVINKHKRRNVSDNLAQASREHYKYHEGYEESSPKLLLERKKVKVILKQKDQSQVNEKEDVFQAWEMSDNYASKHGIEQYAKEQDNEVSEKSNASAKKEEKSKKYRKRITFRHLNQ